MNASNNMSRNGNKAMILAAGLGTRLRPLTNTTPKALIPVNGRPLIHYAIGLLQKHGIREIMINLHHHGEQIEAALGNGQELGVSLHYSHEPEILGTGGGLKKAAPFFEDQNFWVINCDIIIDADLNAIATQHQARQALATMVLRPHPIQQGSPERPTALFLNEESRIVRVASGDMITHYKDDNPMMFTGLHLINPKLLAYLPDGFSCIFQQAYQPAMSQDNPIYGAIYEGYWRDLGTMAAYQQADEELAAGKIELSYC